MPGTTWGEYAEEASKAGGGFGPHPVGTFNMRVESAEVKPAKNDRKAVLARMITIDGPAAGKSLLNNMSPYKNDGDANGYFMQELAALGFGRETNPQFWQAMDGLTHEQGVAYVASAIVGATATVTVTHRKYQDNMTDNVKGMVPIGTKEVTTVLEPEIVQPTLPGAAPVPGVANPVTPVPGTPPVAVAPVAAPSPVPVATPPVASVPTAVPTPVAAPATPAAAPPVAPAEAPVAAAPEVAEVAPATDVPAAPVATPVAVAVTPVAAPVPPVARPEGAPF